jgi:hypothetical protein
MNYQNGDFQMNIVSNEMGLLDKVLTPELKQSVVNAAKSGAIEGVKFVWEEYKIPITLVGAALAITFILENVANAKIIAKKG